MINRQSATIAQIPIDQIRVVNPRSRGRHKFKQIVANISRLGLKRPITVAERPGRDGVERYDLVCGQGRLEALRGLGETTVPAFVIDASAEDALLMSLAENLARRHHSPAEMVRELATLRDRGYRPKEIAEKTDLSPVYVQAVLRLLKDGEESLLRAVAAGRIPVSVAVTIANSDDATVQRALAEAYENNDLRGKQLLHARRLIEKRRNGNSKGRRRNQGDLDGGKLMDAFRKETAKQRALVQRAKLYETRLVFVVSAFRQLFADATFVDLVKAAELAKLPQHLAEQIERGDD